MKCLCLATCVSGMTGINSGIYLMHLQRMRELQPRAYYDELMDIVSTQSSLSFAHCGDSLLFSAVALMCPTTRALSLSLYLSVLYCVCLFVRQVIY